MELFLIVVGVVALITITEIVVSKKKIETKNKTEKNCPPHRWEYNESGKMFCVLCKNFPGYVKTDHGNYQ